MTALVSDRTDEVLTKLAENAARKNRAVEISRAVLDADLNNLGLCKTCFERLEPGPDGVNRCRDCRSSPYTCGICKCKSSRYNDLAVCRGCQTHPSICYGCARLLETPTVVDLLTKRCKSCRRSDLRCSACFGGTVRFFSSNRCYMHRWAPIVPCRTCGGNVCACKHSGVLKLTDPRLLLELDGYADFRRYDFVDLHGKNNYKSMRSRVSPETRRRVTIPSLRARERGCPKTSAADMEEVIRLALEPSFGGGRKRRRGASVEKERKGDKNKRKKKKREKEKKGKGVGKRSGRETRQASEEVGRRRRSRGLSPPDQQPVASSSRPGFGATYSDGARNRREEEVRRRRYRYYNDEEDEDDDDDDHDGDGNDRRDGEGGDRKREEEYDSDDDADDDGDDDDDSDDDGDGDDEEEEDDRDFVEVPPVEEQERLAIQVHIPGSFDGTRKRRRDGAQR